MHSHAPNFEFLKPHNSEIRDRNMKPTAFFLVVTSSIESIKKSFGCPYSQKLATPTFLFMNIFLKTP